MFQVLLPVIAFLAPDLLTLHRSTAVTFRTTYTEKHLGYFNHILGCLSCIGVTKECYQIDFLSSLRSFFSLGEAVGCLEIKANNTWILLGLQHLRGCISICVPSSASSYWAISYPHLSENLYWLHSWHYYHNHTTKELSSGTCVGSKKQHTSPEMLILVYRLSERRYYISITIVQSYITSLLPSVVLQVRSTSNKLSMPTATNEWYFFRYSLVL